VSVVVEEGPGFHVERTDVGATLIASGNWSAQADRVLDSGGVDGLDLNYAKGFKDTNLAFVRAWPIKRLTILARTVKDLTPIYRLSSTLEALSVQSAPTATIDLAKFPLLESLSAAWIQVRSSIGERPGLKDLYLGSYSEIDLGPLRWNSQLVRLRLKDRPRLQTLVGIESLPLIEHLGIYGAPLRDITALAELEGTQLRELHLQSCQIQDLGPVACSAGLRLLNASECGEVESVRPLAPLGDLEVLWLFGTTKVLDDDLGPIGELPRLRELRMRARRSYRPSVEEIQAAIERRHSS
jgi:internalin A